MKKNNIDKKLIIKNVICIRCELKGVFAGSGCRAGGKARYTPTLARLGGNDGNEDLDDDNEDCTTFTTPDIYHARYSPHQTFIAQDMNNPTCFLKLMLHLHFLHLVSFSMNVCVVNLDDYDDH